MRSQLYFGLMPVAFAGALIMAHVGCGGGGTGGTGGSGGQGGGPSTSSSSSSTSGPSSSSSSGSVDGNDTPETATVIEIDTPFDEELYPTGDVDYFTFNGTKGQALFILTQAQGSSLAFDPDTINTVITLYDENQVQIAENNDRQPQGSNDSELFTILPATGKYYLRVTECWSLFSSSTCSGPEDKSNTTYSLSVIALDPTAAGNIEDDESLPNVPVTFSKSSSGYYLSVIYGTYTDATDVDVFSMTIPADAVNPPAGTRTTITEYLLRSGKNGNGSTTSIGRVYVTDAADATNTPIAMLNATDFSNRTPRLQPPLDFSKDYLLWVERPAGMVGTNDFYFLLHGQGYSNPLEADDAGNDMPAGAEVLTLDNNGVSYFIEGDFTSDTDVDHYAVSAPSGTMQVAFACTAHRSGSGARGFLGELHYTDPSTMMDKLLVNSLESAQNDAFTNYVNLPAGVTDLVFKVAVTKPQDPNVSSSFYRCGVHFQ